MLVHVQVYGCIHSRDEQRHVRSLAIIRASPAMTHRYHVPLVRACLQVGRCQLRQSSENQMYRLSLYLYALWLCDGSSRGKSASADILVQLPYRQESSRSLTRSLTMFEWYTTRAAADEKLVKATNIDWSKSMSILDDICLKLKREFGSEQLIHL